MSLTRKQIIALFLAAMLSACTAVKQISKSDTTEFAIETAAVLAGKMVADRHPELIAPVQAYAAMLATRDVSAEDLNAGISALNQAKIDPMIINRILALGQRVGMDVNLDDGKILGLVNVDDHLLAVAIKGFVAGAGLNCAEPAQ